ncbi:MAG TPA: ImmA/IrrE family metallo-endopeptidase [Bacteroidia bacterium]|nr:ImmA/IrrE family metallo-endopeptidase [Bacteroidia bacterium]
MPAEQKTKGRLVRGFRKKAEDHAVSFRETLGLEYHDHLPARVLAEHLSVPIICPSNIKGLSDHHLDVLLKPNKSKWSAATIEVEDGTKLIIHNSSHAPTRQESDLMHELAHLICGHEMSAIGKNRKEFPFAMRDFDENQENEANWLGGCLQMPREGLVWAFRNGMSIDQIALHYKASKAMANFRVFKEGLHKQFKL